MTNRTWAPVGLMVLCVGRATFAAAPTTGSIQGRVTDELTGKPIAGAQVSARGPALSGTQTARSDADGRYHVTLLPPGEYVVEVRSGDVTVERPGIAVGAGETLALDVPVL